MALCIIRDISSEFSGQWYTLMVDETTYLSNTEHIVVCLRDVTEDLEVHEEVLGLYSLESTNADTVVSTITDVLLRMNLKLCDCRGQCYNGTSSMSGSRSGVATKILAEESKALYTRCYGHALNLATQDCLKGIKIMQSTLDTVYELIKKSPKCDVLFNELKEEITTGSPGIRVLWPTRWTLRGEALTSIAENYQALQATWSAASDETRDSKMRARISGVAAQMEHFNFFFGVELGRKMLHNYCQ